MAARIAIMQPYFFPYIGYFQLISAVDKFIIYDNVKYTKKGWINRNRILQNGIATPLSLPLKSDSDSLDICQRTLATDFDPDKLLNQICGAYRKAPHFQAALPIIERVLHHKSINLFAFLRHSLVQTCNFLNISTPIETSSEIAINHDLRSKDKVLAICSNQNSKIYINPIGGTELYAKEEFHLHGINLQFLKSGPLDYQQFESPFIPWLSIIDVIMFNSVNSIKSEFISKYELT